MDRISVWNKVRREINVRVRDRVMKPNTIIIRGKVTDWCGLRPSFTIRKQERVNDEVNVVY